MEMQQGFHPVNMDGSASDVLQLSSSASSSPSTSPDTPSSASSFPIQSPPVLQPQLSYRVLVPAAAALDTTALPYLCTREQALKSLKECIPHTLRLQQLQKEDRAHRKDASWHKKAARRLSKELYLVVSIYALLQGALFTAVAQSTVFTCSDWWGPAGIVGAVTLGTISRTLDKLRRMGHQKQEVRKFERRQSAVYDKIRQLYARGSACSLEASSEPAHNTAFESEPGMVCIFSVHGLLVLGFLAGFSFLIMVSCILMLCRSCHCHY